MSLHEAVRESEMDHAIDKAEISREHPAFRVAFGGIDASYWRRLSLSARYLVIDEYHSLVAQDYDGESE